MDAYEALARAENPDFNKLYEMDCRLHETWFAAMDKMYLWSTLQNAHADYSRFRMLDTMTTGGLDEVIADHRNLLNAIERGATLPPLSRWWSGTCTAASAALAVS